MTKILLLLSAVVMGVAALFAYQNGRTFKAVREDKTRIHKDMSTELARLTEGIDKINSKIKEVTTAQTAVEGESAKLKQQRLTISQTEGEVTATEGQLKMKMDKLNELNTQLAKLPPGFNPKTISEDINKIRQEIAELQTQAEAKKTEVTAEQKKVADAQKILADIQEKIEARKKSFERNSMRSRIVAVNNDWGFVVLDAGESAGITPDTKLLITRGTQTVGKLTIIAVQGARTVANVIPDSLAPGMAPAPGDTVILENLFQ